VASGRPEAAERTDARVFTTELGVSFAIGEDDDRAHIVVDFPPLEKSVIRKGLVLGGLAFGMLAVSLAAQLDSPVMTVGYTVQSPDGERFGNAGPSFNTRMGSPPRRMMLPSASDPSTPSPSASGISGRRTSLRASRSRGLATSTRPSSGCLREG